jgi:hypothetical protein
MPHSSEISEKQSPLKSVQASGPVNSQKEIQIQMIGRKKRKDSAKELNGRRGANRKVKSKKKR